MMSAEATPSKKMATLTDTMEMFNKFHDDDEKSSDEESFHLPIDDDESEKRDITVNGKEESEDDILDKFDSASGTADEDAALEERLLEEPEEKSDKRVENTNGVSDKCEMGPSANQEEACLETEVDNDDLNTTLVNNDEEADKTDENEDSSVGQPEVLEQTEAMDTVDQDELEGKTESVVVNGEDEKMDEGEKPEEKNDTKNVQDEDDGEKLESQPEKLEEPEKMEVEAEKVLDSEAEKLEDEAEKLEDEPEKLEDKTDEPEKTDEEPEKSEDVPEKTEDEPEKTEDEPEKTDDEPEKTEDVLLEDGAKSQDEATVDEEDKLEDDIPLINFVNDKTHDKDGKTDDAESTDNIREPDKCENSNDSGKTVNSGEDLLNISVIRDVEEDDENAREELTKDKELREAEDESCDKVSETDDKEDAPMDYEDESSSQHNEDETITEKTDDAVTVNSQDEDSEMKDDDKESEAADKTEEIQENGAKDDEKHEDSGKENVNPDDESSKEATSKSGKRSLSEVDDDDTATKKIKLAEEKPAEEEPAVVELPKVLTSFASFMKNKKLSDQLTRSDLEQFCLQKICETILHKTDVGDLHQKIKNHEATIDALRKDLTQLTKQARDLEIVNKKLMNELRFQNGSKKPLVPLKITRSVGLQVKLNVPVDNARRRQSAPQTPIQNKPTTPVTQNRQVVRSIANTNVVRQVNASPQKTTPILNQALQPRRQTPTAAAATTAQKRGNFTQVRTKGAEPARASVIDLTDEDDRAAKVKNLQKTMASPMKTVTVSQNKTINVGGNKTITVNQTKTIPLTQQKPGNRLSGGVRLTPTQLKNANITLPAGVVTSSSPQLMYVVQPTSTLAQGIVTSTGTQKAVIVNFQPTNGILTSSLNGSAVSVIPTKNANTVQLKTIAPRKHPAPLPSPPVVRVNVDGPLKPVPPKPHLSIRKTDNGIILQWKMPYSLEHYETIASYQLYAYQETNAAPSTDMWRRVGDVKALALPMACTLTQFADKNKYYFAVRSVDVHKRIGAFSDPEEISL